MESPRFIFLNCTFERIFGYSIMDLRHVFHSLMIQRDCSVSPFIVLNIDNYPDRRGIQDLELLCSSHSVFLVKWLVIQSTLLFIWKARNWCVLIPVLLLTFNSHPWSAVSSPRKDEKAISVVGLFWCSFVDIQGNFVSLSFRFISG